MNKKISIKELVLTGVFAIIYMIVMFAIGMMGIIPILYLFVPTILGLTGGVIISLFMAKVQKPFATTIIGLIPAIYMSLSGYPFIAFIHSIIILIVVEILRYAGKYKSFTMNAIANGVFNMSICSSLMLMTFYKEEVRSLVVAQMGADYTNSLYSILTTRNLVFVYIGAFVGGVVGAILAKKLLKKHFEKAGII